MKSEQIIIIMQKEILKLREENEKLRKENEELKEYKWMYEENSK